jgi:hypothetical protein
MKKHKFNIIEEITYKTAPFDQSVFFNNPQQEDFTIRAYHEGNQVAYLKCYHESEKLYAFEVQVNSDYRRNKIATKMYNYAEEISGRTIHPHHENPFNENSDGVSNEALAFWKFRKG